jgi:predicted  nucleic acid-binding Zn-ribbon protein
MTAKCTFCGKIIYDRMVLMDLNNNTYCKECGEKQFEINTNNTFKNLKKQLTL